MLIKSVSVKRIENFQEFWSDRITKEEREDATKCFGDVYEYIDGKDRKRDVRKEIEVIEHVLVTRSEIYLLDEDEYNEGGYYLLEYNRAD